jgi:hypothetical protein
MFHRRFVVYGVASLALAAGTSAFISSASAAEAKLVTVDDLTKVEYRITVPGQAPVTKGFTAVNTDFAETGRGDPIDIAKTIKVSYMGGAVVKAVAQAHADADGNGYLNTAELVRLAVVVLGRRAVPQGADAEAAQIDLYMNGQPVEGPVKLANKQQAIGLARLVDASQAAPIVGPIMKAVTVAINDANMDRNNQGGGGY